MTAAWGSSTSRPISAHSTSNMLKKTLEYLFELWKKPVHLKTFNHQRETTALTYAASRMQIGK
jgi:spore cortex formation protein SpoVR/YcgB (stage V sporulation)